jgi:uncharacterized protein YggU (UPF0235/DUF167 family)
VPAAPGPPWAAGAHGVTLSVRLTPKGGRDAIDGIAVLADGHAVLKVRVAAPPSEGAANQALGRLIAKALGIPARDVALAAGATARIKRLEISGDTATLIASLEKVVAPR